MTRWQYAWLTDQPQTVMGFSHPQSGLAAELATVLGPGVFLQQSTEWSIGLDRMRVNLGYVSGLLGDRGWEMFAVETRLQPGAMSPAQLQTNWYFKRPAPEMHAAAAAQSHQAGAPMSSGSAGSPGFAGAAAWPLAGSPSSGSPSSASPASPASPSSGSPASTDPHGVGFASINPNPPGAEQSAGTTFPAPPGAPGAPGSNPNR